MKSFNDSDPYNLSNRSRQTGQTIFYNKSCKRFRGITNQFDPSGPVVFLKLREMGCERHEAVTFCGKNTCRYDSTRKADGPANFRTLKVKSLRPDQLTCEVF